MEKGLRISFFIMFPIITGILYFLLKKEGNLAMGGLIVFMVISIPIFLINIGRCFNNKIKKIFYFITIFYILSFNIFIIIKFGYERLVNISTGVHRFIIDMYFSY